MNDTRRVCRVRLPALPPALRTNRRALGVYFAGALFAAGWWFFLDAAMRSTHLQREPGDGVHAPGRPHVDFVDWIPALCTTFGLLVTNLVEKQHLLDDTGGFGGAGAWGNDPIQWRTRLWLFLGFSFLAGGMAGSCTVLIVKYIANDAAAGYVEFGVANVVQNLAIMGCAILLWYSQRVESDYEYNLTL
ncbi:Vacuolar protein sorting-associated protein 68 [Malassezia sp. CBS 17886]|nr:Vacuolar protein sorting-associated protein 68 [Malassezia sp. CBS 17886]